MPEPLPPRVAVPEKPIGEMTIREYVAQLRKTATGGYTASVQHDDQIKAAWWSGYLEAVNVIAALLSDPAERREHVNV